MDLEKIKQAYEESFTIAEEFPDEFRKQIFQELFRINLSKNLSGNPPKVRSTTFKTPDFQQSNSSVEGILGTEIDYSPFHNAIVKGNWADRAVVILYTLETKLGIAAMSAPDLAKLMKEQLRLPQVYRQNVYRDLRKSTYFIKTKIDRGDNYSLSVLGHERAKELAQL